MSLNDGARIVPFAEANAMLRAAMGPGVVLPEDEVARVQLVTRAAAEEMVERFLRSNLAFSQLSYGRWSPDYPLCWDFAKFAVALIGIGCLGAGLAARPYFFRLHYTRPASRHAINGVVLADGAVLYLEPQGIRWLERPADLVTYDRVKL